MNLYKICTEKPYSFLVIDTTLASDNPLPFWKKYFWKNKRLIMKRDDKFRSEKLQYYINREPAKIALWSGKIDKWTGSLK